MSALTMSAGRRIAYGFVALVLLWGAICWAAFTS
jgi:hypothetical protein